MKYTQTTPCKECPFLNSMRHGFTMRKLMQFSEGEFPCHKSAEINDEGEFQATDKSVHCAGALIFREKRDMPNQMMRICERLGMYDRTKLDMTADIR